jgi:hypothetical protein
MSFRLRSRTVVCAALTGSALLAWQAVGETAAQPRVVRLRNAFIGAVKNRATISDLPFTFDHVKSSINAIGSGGDDGDLHVSGRPGPFVALPMVAEVVNARLEQTDVVQQVRLLGTSKKANISGFWRLWFEHPPSTVLVQGGTVPKPTNTNPDHIFEIHPITNVDGHEADQSFVPIPGYTAYTANKAFGAYEKLTFSAKQNTSFTTVTSVTVGFNYTEFDAVLAGAPMPLNDAIFVLADVLGVSGNSVVSSPRRLVFAAGTKAASAFTAKSPKKGTKIRVLGIPRVNLDILSDAAAESPGETVTRKGAYEIIVVGVR